MVFLLLLAGLSGQANDALITQTNFMTTKDGKVLVTESCSIFNDRTVIDQIYGTSNSHLIEVKNSRLSDNVKEVLKIAATEPTDEFALNLCSSTTTHIQGHATDGDDIDLYSTGGCGRPQRQHQGKASRLLRRLVISHCALEIN